jgi:hypothetical protein
MDDFSIKPFIPSLETNEVEGPQNELENTSSASVSENAIEQPVQFEAPLKNSAQAKQLNLDGSAKQFELNQKLAAGKTHTTDFPADAGNDKLKEINVHRQVGDTGGVGEIHGTITNYPNGVKVKRAETNTVRYPDVIEADRDMGSIQKEGSPIKYEITAPPGGRVDKNKDGGLSVFDDTGKEVARMDKNGNVEVHTKHGDYKEEMDGKIHFSTKEKTNPGSLKKEGPVAPGDYENYGISKHGKTIRFPNGVEYTPADHDYVDVDAGSANAPIRVKRESEGKIHIPPGLGGMKIDYRGNGKHGNIEPTKTIDGKPLVRGSTDRVKIPVEGGEFEVDRKGNVIYQPDKH